MDTIGFDCHADGGRSKDSLLYQQLAIVSPATITNIAGYFATDLAKPFGEVIVLMFEIGEHPPSAGSETQ
jgi:hypothetical protein